MSFFIADAWAQTGGGQSNPLAGFLLPVALLAVLYFLIFRPQQKRQKEHRQMVEALASGDEVVTGGGVLGRVTEVGEQFVTVEIANGISVKVQKHTVGTVLPKGTIKSV